MRTPKNHPEKTAELKLVSDELNKMISDGSFYRLSFANRSAWIKRVKKLYNGLRGPLDGFKLKPFLAAGAVSAAAMLTTGCPALGSGGDGTITPAFAAPVTNSFGLADVGFYASPCFVDIDNDGDLDAFVGNDIGNTLYFQNSGTASAPAFDAPVTNPFGLAGVVYFASPCFVDIDNDGDLDAFVGNVYGNTFYFENTGTASAPAFAAPVTNPFGLADVGYAASPCFIDIDNDGDLDAFVSNDNGNTLYFKNSGTASAPAFDAPLTNPFGLADVGFFASPCIVDIDNDGDLDAFVGNGDGNTLYFENTGTASAPAFASSVTNPFGLADVGVAALPCFVDIDNDDDLDAFVGDYDGNTLYFRDMAH